MPPGPRSDWTWSQELDISDDGIEEVSVGCGRTIEIPSLDSLRLRLIQGEYAKNASLSKYHADDFAALLVLSLDDLDEFDVLAETVAEVAALGDTQSWHSQLYDAVNASRDALKSSLASDKGGTGHPDRRAVHNAGVAFCSTIKTILSKYFGDTRPVDRSDAMKELAENRHSDDITDDVFQERLRGSLHRAQWAACVYEDRPHPELAQSLRLLSGIQESIQNSRKGGSTQRAREATVESLVKLRGDISSAYDKVLKEKPCDKRGLVSEVLSSKEKYKQAFAFSKNLTAADTYCLKSYDVLKERLDLHLVPSRQPVNESVVATDVPKHEGTRPRRRLR